MGDPKILLVSAALGATLLLAVGVLTFLLLRKRSPKRGAVDTQAALDAHTAKSEIADPRANAESVNQQMQNKLHEQEALQEQADAAALSSLKLPAVTTKKSEVLVKHLRDSVNKDTPGSANILRSWLTENSSE